MLVAWLLLLVASLAADATADGKLTGRPAAAAAAANWNGLFGIKKGEVGGGVGKLFDGLKMSPFDKVLKIDKSS